MSFKIIVGSTTADFLVWQFFWKSCNQVSWLFSNILSHQGRMNSYNSLWGRTLDLSLLQYLIKRIKQQKPFLDTFILQICIHNLNRKYWVHILVMAQIRVRFLWTNVFYSCFHMKQDKILFFIRQTISQVKN